MGAAEAAARCAAPPASSAAVLSTATVTGSHRLHVCANLASSLGQLRRTARSQECSAGLLRRTSVQHGGSALALSAHPGFDCFQCSMEDVQSRLSVHPVSVCLQFGLIHYSTCDP